MSSIVILRCQHCDEAIDIGQFEGTTFEQYEQNGTTKLENFLISHRPCLCLSGKYVIIEAEY